MKSNYRIAHFSDFHLSDTGKEFERASRLLRDAIEFGVDHIVITGDVVDAAQTGIIKTLWGRLRRWGWTSAARMTFAPGNHDIFPVTKQFPYYTWGRPTKHFERLCELTRSCRRGQGVQAPDNPYPSAKVLSPAVVLVALDSTRNHEQLPFRWAEGELPSSDRRTVSALFQQHLHKPHRIVAMHHTPCEVQSESQHFNMNFAVPSPGTVQRWLERCGATLVLCGHVHGEVFREKLGRKCWVLTAGTAGGVDDEDCPDKAMRTYHIIECLPNGRVRFIHRSFRGCELDET